MDQRTEQERMNNIHTGWEKYKKLNPDSPISPEFDEMIETRMMEANGLKPPLTKEEYNQEKNDLIANHLQRMLIQNEREKLEQEELARREKAAGNTKKRNFKFYVGATALVLGIGAATLFRNEIGGAINNVVKTIVDYDNQKLEDEYEAMSEQVYKDTGMTPEEIMEKGRNIH